MFNTYAKTLCIFSHPNHEIALYGFLQRTIPSVAFLTDGGGGVRVLQTAKGLDKVGNTQRWFLNYPEDALYQGLLKKDLAFYQTLVDAVAKIITDEAPEQIMVGAVEYYNPIHDMAFPIVLAAMKKLASGVRIYTVPLVYQGWSSESFVFQRSLPGARQWEHTIFLNADEGVKKREALADIYTALSQQMSFTPEVVGQACREEHFVVPGSPLDPVDTSCEIRYDRRGKEAVKAGTVKEAITYEGNFKPLVQKLFLS